VRRRRGSGRRSALGVAGTCRAGSETLVLLSGPAICRSKSVNAFTSSHASNARFRRPARVFVRMPVDSNAAIALFAVLYETPSVYWTLLTVTIGVAGSRSSRVSAVASVRIDPSRARHSTRRASTRRSKDSASPTAREHASANRPTQSSSTSAPPVNSPGPRNALSAVRQQSLGRGLRESVTRARAFALQGLDVSRSYVRARVPFGRFRQRRDGSSRTVRA
jgi:hypothetical protein